MDPNSRGPGPRVPHTDTLTCQDAAWESGLAQMDAVNLIQTQGIPGFQVRAGGGGGQQSPPNLGGGGGKGSIDKHH